MKLMFRSDYEDLGVVSVAAYTEYLRSIFRLVKFEYP